MNSSTGAAAYRVARQQPRPGSRPILSSLPARQFAGFVGVGAAAATLALVTRAVTNLIVPFEAAVVIGHLVGMLFAFTMNRRFIFPATTRPVWSELGRFALVNLGSLTLTTVVSSWLFRLILPALGVDVFPGLVAHVIGLGSSALPSFLAHKFFSFRGPRAEAAHAKALPPSQPPAA